MRDMMNRRGLLLGLGSLIAAPAIVPISSLMKLPRKLWVGDGIALHSMCHPTLVELMHNGELIGLQAALKEVVDDVTGFNAVATFEAAEQFTANGVRVPRDGKWLYLPFVDARTSLPGDKLIVTIPRMHMD